MVRWIRTAIRQLVCMLAPRKKRRDKWESLPIEISREDRDWWRVIRRRKS